MALASCLACILCTFVELLLENLIPSVGNKCRKEEGRVSRVSRVSRVPGLAMQ